MNKPLMLSDFYRAEPRVVSGAGGGSSKGGGSGGSSTSPDTLFSSSSVQIVGLIGEGDIGGVVGGLKGVYRNDTPIQNQDGSLNFKGFTAQFRVGSPDQPYLTGYESVASEQSVGINVRQSTPVIATVSDPDLDRVRVTVYVPALFVQKTDGTMKANFVDYRIEIRYYNGPWVSQGDQKISGKTMSGYFRQHSCPLPKNPSGASAPWQVRLTRISPDDEPFNDMSKKYTVQSTLNFYSVTNVIDTKFTYPHSAVVGLSVTTSVLGDSVGDFKTLVDGKTMKVPSNRTSSGKNRTYSGVWDGTFKEEVCDSPIWTLYLLLENDLFGIGEFIDVDSIDKVTFYEIGRYCDQLVPDGAGGMEPRYTFNAEITTQQQAYDLIQLIAQIYRGMVFWSTGSVTSTQDRPGDPKILVNAENVLGDGFSYSSSARKARHTVAMVRWHDPTNLYRENIEFVESREGIELYGYNPIEIDLLGCTSRGQAHRAGLWTLFTEIYETQVVTYQAGLDHVMIRPGHIVQIQDPQISNLDLSGRLLDGSSATTINLDRGVTLKPGVSYTVSVTMPNANTSTRGISSSGTDASGRTILNLANGLEQTPDKAAIWQISGDIIPQLFRVVSVKESQPHVYDVTALQHEPAKYAAIDNGAAFQETPFSEFPYVVLPPKNLAVREAQFFENNVPKQGLVFSWTPGQLLNSSTYYVTVVTPSGEVRNYPKSASTSLDIGDAPTGHYKFVVTAVGATGRVSEPAFLEYDVVGWAGVLPATVANLQLLSGGTVFSGRSPTVTWANQFPNGMDPYQVRNVIYVYDASTNALLHREMLVGSQNQWTYDYNLNINEGGPRRRLRVAVTATSPSGAEGGATSILIENPVPGVVQPVLDATSETLFVTLERPSDSDFQGFLIWVSETSGFNPLVVPPVEDTSSRLTTIKGVTGRKYYVRAAGYDAFSKNVGDLNISTEVSITLTGNAFDVTDPGIPQNVALSTASVIAPDGTVSSSITATWNALTSPNLGKYEVSIAEGASPPDGAYVGGIYLTGTSFVQKGLTPGVVYSIRVRSISQNGFGISGWSTVKTITAALNTVPPNPVTGLSVIASFQNAFLSWTNPTNTDLGSIEIWGGATNALGSATLIATVSAPGTWFADSTLATTGTRFYWARSVNTSKVPATSFAGPVQATSAALVGAQIAAKAVDATKFADTIAAVEIFGVLPTAGNFDGRQVFLTTDKKVYRYSATLGAFTRSTDGADLVANSITAGQIQVGAIGADQIGAGAITAGKLAVGLNTGNLLWNSDIAVQGLWPAPTGLAGAIRGYRSDFAVTGTTSVYIYKSGTPAAGNDTYIDYPFPDGSGTVSSLLPVQPGAQYEFSAYLSVHRCIGFIQVFWYDGTNYSAAVTSNLVTNNGTSGAPADTWRAKIMATAPASAKSVLVRLTARFTAESEPYVFASAWYMGKVPVGTTAYSDYTPQSATIIDGGAINTNTLDASKIKANTITTDRLQANQINVDTIAALRTISGDKIKVNTVEAQSINISGTTTLANWRNGTDSTKIEGGSIYANSINANSLKVGSRGLSFAGVEFQWERNAAGAYTNVFKWTAGGVFYNNNAGAPTYFAIAEGSVTYIGVSIYVYWDVTNPGVLTGINAGDWTSVYSDPNRVMVCLSFAVGQLMPVYGGTIIDGSKITTLSIDTAQLRTDAVTARVIKAESITAVKIAVDSITGDRIAANTLTAKHIYLRDTSNMLANGDLSEGIAGWSLGAGTTIDNPGGTDPGGPYRFVCGTGSTYAIGTSGPYNCSPGDVIYVSAMVYNGRGAGNAGIILQILDASGNYITNALPVATAAYNTWVRIEGQYTIPAGAARMLFIPIADIIGSNGANVHFGRMQLRRANGASLIVDGSITAVKVAAKSITASKLVVGTGNNMILNAAGTSVKADGYQMGVYGEGVAVLQPLRTDNSSLPGVYPFCIRPPTVPPTANSFGQVGFRQLNSGGLPIATPVVGGQRYEFSCYVRPYDATSSVLYVDAFLSGGGAVRVFTDQRTGFDIRLGGFVTMPADAISAVVSVGVYWSGGSNPHLFVSAPLMAGASAEQTELSPFTVGQQTTIDGTGIRSSSITADRLSVGSLSAITANVGVVTAGILQSPDGKTVINLANGNITVSD